MMHAPRLMGTRYTMQLFRIRGTVAYISAFVTFAVALALGAPVWAAILIGIVGGPTISWAIFSWGPLSRWADRADHWLETPK